jgi:hypothetical protein
MDRINNNLTQGDAMAKTAFSATPSDPTPAPNATFLNTIYGSGTSGGHRHDAGTNDGSADKIDFPNEIKNSPWVDVRTFASLSAAVSAIGSVISTALLIPNAHTVSSDSTIPGNIHVIITESGSLTTSGSGTDLVFNGALTVHPGGILTIASSTSLKINRAFRAGEYQVFSGGGSIIFGFGSIAHALLEWWGGLADDVGTGGSTNNDSAMEALLASYMLGTFEVRLLKGIYRYDSTKTLTASHNGLLIKGSGRSISGLRYSGSGDGFHIGGNCNLLYWSDFGLSSSTGNDAIRIHTGTSRLTLKASGYVNCVPGDVGKTVVGNATGATGTLTAYDNGTWQWQITGFDSFMVGESLTISTGTGSSVLNNINTLDGLPDLGVSTFARLDIRG